MASSIRLDRLIKKIDLDVALFTSKRLFQSYVSILRATLGHFGSSDGRELPSVFCSGDISIGGDIFGGSQGLPFCCDSQNEYIDIYQEVSNFLSNSPKPVVSNFVMIDDWCVYEKKTNKHNPDVWVYGFAGMPNFSEYVKRPDDSFYAKIMIKDDGESDHEKLMIVNPNDHDENDSSITALEYVAIFPQGYFSFLEILRRLCNSSMLPIQPILSDYNMPPISLPNVLNFGTIWIYEHILLKYRLDESERKFLPPWQEIFEKIDVYESIMGERFRIIENEVAKQEYVESNANGNRHIKEGGPIWSIIMTKEAVYRKLNWSRTTLYRRLKKYPKLIMDLGRQNYRFDCNSDVFCSLEPDEAFNRMLSENN